MSIAYRLTGPAAAAEARFDLQHSRLLPNPDDEHGTRAALALSHHLLTACSRSLVTLATMQADGRPRVGAGA